MKWVDNHIEIEPPKKPKLISGTRFASLFGLNPYATAFNVWCAITRTYEAPFEDNKYTIAGKVIEPLIIEYLKKAYAMDNLVTPIDRYGKDFFQKTWGNFFKGQEPLSGMWDCILVDEKGRTSVVIEIKTTSRSEDWAKDVPEYYALQAALYAYLLGVDDVIMVAAFLEEKDYSAPEQFEPSADNTIAIEFKVSERYPDFQGMIDTAMAWWNDYVLTGISPDFDERQDAEILKALRTNNLSPDMDITALLKEAETLKAEIDTVSQSIAEREKRFNVIKGMIQEHAKGSFRDGDKKVEIRGGQYTWSLSRSETTTVDKEALQADGLLEKYSKVSPRYTMTVK